MVHPGDHTRLAFDCAEAEVSAKETLLRYAMGDFSKAKDVDQYPEFVSPRPTPPKAAPSSKPSKGGKPLIVAEHWAAFVAEGQYASGTSRVELYIDLGKGTEERTLKAFPSAKP